EALDALDPATLRALLPGFLAAHVADDAAAARNRARTAELLARASDEEVMAALAQLRTLGDEPRVYPANPLCRAVGRTWTREVVTELRVEGADRLAEAAARGPVVLLCNHVSYFDSSAIDAALVRSGHQALADRTISAAGPKVYGDLFRRFASGCLSTLPVPQSTSLGHTAALSPRELARRAISSLHA